MTERISIQISNLIIDTENPRFPFTPIGSPETLRTLLPRQQRQILALAKHIATHGLNIADLPIVIPADAASGRYLVLDGNRRLIVLKALENPDLLAAALCSSALAQIREFSKTYHNAPIESLLCACVKNRDEATPWIELRHPGSNQRAGIVPLSGIEPAGFRAGDGVVDTPSKEMPWSPDQIAFVIMTVKRPAGYLHKTVHSLSSADPQYVLLKEIDVAVDDLDASWVPDLPPPKTLNAVPLTNEESIRANSYGLHRRACHNYYRALKLASSYRGLIVCEDDIIFREGWIGMLCQSLNEMQSHGLNDIVLSLYSPHDHEARWLRRGTFYSSYVASSFYGTQCVFYTPKDVQEIIPLIWKRGVENYEGAYDLLLKGHCQRKQNLYAPRVALAQHIGRKSTGLGGWHCSPTFQYSWPGAPLAAG